MNGIPVRALVNGTAVEQVSIFDRGLHYGDGLFETIAVHDGAPLEMPAHLARMQAGCQRLGLCMPDPGVLDTEAQRLCAGHGRAVLKLIVSRGVGGRGYRPDPASSHTRILLLYPWPDYPAGFSKTGIVLRLCGTRLAIQPQLAGIKHLNRLEQVLARAEWDDPGVPEGLMQDTEGRVIECTQSNLFLVCGDQLITPDLSRCGIAGIMRARIIDHARTSGIACAVRDVALEELADADEVFVCNSLIGIWPVQAFATHRYLRSGMTGRLQQELGLPA